MGYLTAKDKNSLHEAIFFDVMIAAAWIATGVLWAMYPEKVNPGLMAVLFLAALLFTLAYAGFLRPMVTGEVEKPVGPSLQFGKYIQPLKEEYFFDLTEKRRRQRNDASNPMGDFQMSQDVFHRDDN